MVEQQKNNLIEGLLNIEDYDQINSVVPENLAGKPGEKPSNRQ